MPTPNKYKLKLKQLQFVSVVDRPAQEPATTLLIKRDDASSEITATARFVKAVPALGLAFFWAFKSTDENGDAYHDLQGDQVVADDDMIEAAMRFMEDGGLVDQQHDESTIGKVVFAMPMTPDVAKAFSIDTKQSGLMVALKASPDVLEKLQSGEYTGVSIAGRGEREELEAEPREGAQDPEDAPKKPTPRDRAQAPAKSAPTTDPADPETLAKGLLRASVERYAAEHSISNYAVAFTKATTEDAATRAAYDALAAIRNARPPQYVAPDMPAGTTDVVKTARIEVAKAELDLRRAVNAYQSAHKLKSYDEAMALATASDPTARKAFDALSDARERLAKAPTRVATAKLDSELAQLRKSIDSQVEAFSIQHNLLPDEARERLMVVSPSFVKMQERVLAAGHARQVAAQNGGAR